MRKSTSPTGSPTSTFIQTAEREVGFARSRLRRNLVLAAQASAITKRAALDAIERLGLSTQVTKVRASKAAAKRADRSAS